MGFEFIQRGTEFLFDLRRVFVVGDVEDLTKIPVALLKATHL